ncbi:MAG: S1 RNA-binding domain-containing protein [Bradymonadia bacterium]
MTGTITERFRRGFFVDVGIQAYLPGRHLDIRPTQSLEGYLGNTFEFKIIKLDRERGRIIVSRRLFLEQTRAILWANTIKTLKEGDVVKGTVSDIDAYGAWVDIGGHDVRLHISNLSWGWFKHPSDVVSLGEEIQTKVLKIYSTTQRVMVGLKQTSIDPILLMKGKYKRGDRIQVTVKHLESYRAIVEFKEGGWQSIYFYDRHLLDPLNHPLPLMTVGEKVEVYVVSLTENGYPWLNWTNEPIDRSLPLRGALTNIDPSTLK